MLKAINKLGKGARMVGAVGTSSLPVVIIGGLLYAAFFVKAEPTTGELKARPLERRDAFYGVVAPGGATLWAAGSNGKIVRSEDGGTTWGVQDSPVVSHLQSISAWDAQRAVAVGNRGLVVVTADGGKTWKEVKVPHSEVANKLLQVHTYADGVAWAVGELGAVLKTTDYGATWTRALEEKDQAWNDIAFIGQAGWLVGEFGQILRTTDGGQTWAPVQSPVKSSLMSVSFRDALHGVAVGLAGTVLVTSDGGASWKDVPPLTREHLNCVIWDGAGWVAVGDKGIRVSAGPEADNWKAGRISDQDLSWHTQIVKVADDYVLAGANLALLHKDELRILGRD
ncbi:WD40/YVTN/BNR-like repeat-containing protein [Zoogloea sp.]|uniref:WD40/YVTN/BNR-like repeat-containing protein n=1 Tax=Zoogloea sp. TaxID=49181 RepID=UPI0035B0AB60